MYNDPPKVQLIVNYGVKDIQYIFFNTLFQRSLLMRDNYSTLT